MYVQHNKRETKQYFAVLVAAHCEANVLNVPYFLRERGGCNSE